jgi:hypothetical protein
MNTSEKVVISQINFYFCNIDFGFSIPRVVLGSVFQSATQYSVRELIGWHMIEKLGSVLSAL